MALPHRCRHGHRLVDRHIDHLARRLVLDLVDVAADGVELEESLFCESMSDDQSNNNKSVYMLFSTSVFLPAATLGAVRSTYWKSVCPCRFSAK